MKQLATSLLNASAWGKYYVAAATCFLALLILLIQLSICYTKRPPFLFVHVRRFNTLPMT